MPEELTQLRMGKIVRDRYPELSETDQEAIRQHAIAALNSHSRPSSLPAGDGDAGGDESQTRPCSMVCASSRWMSANSILT